MPELRWSLLALGVVFIVALLVWERSRRGRSARDSDPRGLSPDRPASQEPAERTDEVSSAGEEPAPGRRARPQAVAAPREPAVASGARREPLREPPVVEIVDPAVEDAAHGPAVGSLPVISASAGPELGEAAVERAAQWLAETQPSVTPDPARPRRPLRLEWPDDASRRIVALRVVARSGEHFTGGAVRQALQGEGFEFGEFEIFHLPLEDGRVLLSAANLTKPGNFRLERMDTEGLFGLNLFAVLPGPMEPLETFDRLHAVAGTLARRLRGELRDMQGLPLSQQRVAELRHECRSIATPRSAT